MRYNDKQGFSILTSVVIITAVALSIALTVALIGQSQLEMFHIR